MSSPVPRPGVPQPGVLGALPAAAAFLRFDLRPGADLRNAMAPLLGRVHPGHLVVGLGPGLVAALGIVAPGLRPMPEIAAPGASIPSTPSDLWVRVAGADAGEVVHRVRHLAMCGFVLRDDTRGFVHAGGRDLSGYEDGTENPTGADAAAAALAEDGSSIVAVQRWAHDWDAMDVMSKAQMDQVIGRERISNEELKDAPASAHVKRTAQEDFDPEAFVVRRSMPWADHRGAGLLFVAFGATLDPFEAQLRRMTGQDDGILDALFRFTRPVDGATFWCPPLRDGRLSLTAR